MKKRYSLLVFLFSTISVASENLLTEHFTPLEIENRCAFFLPQATINKPDCVAQHMSKGETFNKDLLNANNVCCFVKIPTQIPPHEKEIPFLISNKELSFYWAQELIGSDLLKSELKDLDITTVPVSFINIIDKKEKNHYEHIHNLISDNGNHSIIPKLNEEHIKLFTITQIEDFQTVIFTITDEPPSMINISLSWKDEEDIKESIEELISVAHSFNSIVINSAGNHSMGSMCSNNITPKSNSTLSIEFDTAVCAVDEHKEEMSKKFNTILVGSLSPFGQVSSFSKESPEVTILAPADDYLTSTNKDGNYVNFGYTSGATALVTGSLAAFEWLSGYHPASEEAKVLLKKTAIPTQSSKCGGLHGKGILNTYKLGRVGMRLKEECENNEQQCFKQCETNTDVELCKRQKCNKQECFKNKIQLDSTYQFDFNLQEYEDVKTKFPECEGVPTNRIIPCHEKQEALKKLRKAVLLHPLEKELWDTLSCIHEKNGFTMNAKMLKNINTQIHQECPE